MGEHQFGLLISLLPKGEIAQSWWGMKWFRRLSYTTVLLIIGGLVIAFSGYRWFSGNTERILEWAGARLGYDLIVEKFSVPGPGSVVFEGVTVAKGGHNFLWMQRLELNFDWVRIWKGEVDEVRVLGAYVWLKELQTALASDESKADVAEISAASTGGKVAVQRTFSVLLNRVVLREVILNLNTLGPGIPALPINLAPVDPIVLNQLRLGAGTDGNPILDEIQRAEINNLVIYSPYFPLNPVLSFDRISISFSLAGLANQQIDRFSVQRPTIYIGDDLFWYLEDVRNAQLAAQAEKEESPTGVPEGKLWTLANYDVRGGRLLVALNGTPTVVLPMIFETEGVGMVLGDFAGFQLKTKFEIPKANLDYPEYGVRITNMEGELFFGLPPGEGELNIVPSVRADEVRWKDLAINKVEFGLTFNQAGIFGKFGGFGYDGYVDGGFAIYLEDGFPWQGWGSSTGVQVGPITGILSPQNFVMQGKIDAKFLVKGMSRLIVGLEGEAALNEPGTMTVTAIEDLLKKLPTDWPAHKRDLARIALESFEKYRYERGALVFNYQPPLSTLSLNLDGDDGKRDFEINWHDVGSDGKPKQATPWRKK